MLFLLISMGCPIPNNPSNSSFDLDDDGYFRDEDCDDSNPKVNPGKKRFVMVWIMTVMIG